jgi:acetoin utilization protein AcuC
MSCSTRIIYHESYGRRGFTALPRTWSRYQLFLATLPESPLQRMAPLIEAPAATENDLLQVHSPEFVDLVQQLDLTGSGRLDGSTPAWQGMYDRAERVVGGTLLAADLIASGYATHTFNPAGGQHHAHRDRAGGFCVFNDIVAAVRRFQQHGFERLAVLDVDGHHGDGTESLLAQERVLTISLHQFGERTYPGTGRAEEAGQGDGTGYAMNVPLPRGTGDAAYANILTGTVEPLLRAYRPEVLIAEYGTDGHAADPLLRLQLSTGGYLWMARWLHDLAHALCDGRLLIVGGGGYEPQHVIRCWMLLLGELTGVPAAHVHPDVETWLAEPAAGFDLTAHAGACLAAWRAKQHVYPFYALPC